MTRSEGPGFEPRLRGLFPISKSEASGTWPTVDVQGDGASAPSVGSSEPPSWFGRAQSGVSKAKKLWTEHGGLAQLSESMSRLQERTARLRRMSAAELDLELQQLMATWKKQGGTLEAKQRIQELISSVDSAVALADAHDQRARSVPRHMGRPEPTDPTGRAALKEIKTAAEKELTQWSDRFADWGVDIHAWAAAASEAAWSGAGQVAKDLGGSGSSPVRRWLSEVRDTVATRLDTLSPERLRDAARKARERLADATARAETVMAGLSGVQAVASDPEAVFERFKGALSISRVALDPEADGVGVGFLKEAAAGATGARGTEVVYSKERGELRVLSLDLAGARLGIGGSARPFARSLYGDADAIMSTTRRHAAEVGAFVFHVGAGTSEDLQGKRVRSWHGTLGLGFHASLPLLGDQSAYSIKENEVATIRLSANQKAELDRLLSETSDESRTWTGFIRDTLSFGPPRDPERVAPPA